MRSTKTNRDVNPRWSYLRQLSQTSRGCSIWKRRSLSPPASGGTRSALWSTSACSRSTWLDADERIRRQKNNWDAFNEPGIDFVTSDWVSRSVRADRRISDKQNKLKILKRGTRTGTTARRTAVWLFLQLGYKWFYSTLPARQTGRGAVSHYPLTSDSHALNRPHFNTSHCSGPGWRCPGHWMSCHGHLTVLTASVQ